jgi:hypothetical protein
MPLSFTDSPTDNNFSLGPIVEDDSFVERRAPHEDFRGLERRQFSNSHSELSSAARELALAIDAFKLGHHRRFISFEEMLHVIESLGYRKT